MSVDFRLALCFFAAGCGALADGNYNGKPLVTLRGQVISDASIDINDSIGVTLLWANDFTPAKGSQSVVASAEIPAQYTIEVFRPPPASSRFSLFGDEQFSAVIGEVVLFRDENRDGLWDIDTEGIVGGSFGTALLWVDENSSPLPGLETLPNRAGFHVVDVRTPNPCDGETQEDVFVPRDDFRMDLQAGNFFFEGGVDWDCDGESEWEPPEDESCPPDIEEICQFYNEQLGADEPVTDPGEIFIECMLETCPEVAQTILNPNPEPPNPDEIQPDGAWCEEINARLPEEVVLAPGDFFGGCVIGDGLPQGGILTGRDPENPPRFITNGEAFQIVPEQMVLENLHIDGPLEIFGPNVQLRSVSVEQLFSLDSGLIIENSVIWEAQIQEFLRIEGTEFLADQVLSSTEGEVRDCLFRGSVFMEGASFDRSLAYGFADLEGSLVRSSIFLGDAFGQGEFIGNTVLGALSWDGEVANTVSLEPIGFDLFNGNMVCDETCFTDLLGLDLNPEAPILETRVEIGVDEGIGDYCARPRLAASGALESGEWVSLAEAKIEGECVFLTRPETEPPTEDPTEPSDGGGGCATTPRAGTLLWMIGLVWARRRV